MEFNVGDKVELYKEVCVVARKHCYQGKNLILVETIDTPESTRFWLAKDYRSVTDDYETEYSGYVYNAREEDLIFLEKGKEEILREFLFPPISQLK